MNSAVLVSTRDVGVEICDPQAAKIKQGQLMHKKYLSRLPEGQFGWNKECSHRVGRGANEFADLGSTGM